MSLTTDVYRRLANETIRMQGLIDELAQGDGRLSVLNDEPTERSYSVREVTVKYKVLFENSWAIESGRKSANYTVKKSFSDKIPRYRFLLSLQSEEEIERFFVEEATEVLKLEMQGHLETLGRKPLSPRAKLICKILSSTSEDEIRQNIGELLIKDGVLLDQETSNIRLEEIVFEAFIEYPELLVIAIDNQTSNPTTLQLVRNFIRSQKLAIQSEKDRISRAKKAVREGFADLERSFVEDWARNALLVLGRRQVIQAAKLQELTCEIFMESHEIRKSYKFNLI